MPFILLNSPERVEYAQKVLARLPVSEQAFDMRVEPHKDRRTNEQNARLWALHSAAAKFLGCGAEEVHEEMLCEFFGSTEVKMPNGAIRRVPVKRSSQRDKSEFKEYMDFCEQFYISRLGVFLGE